MTFKKLTPNFMVENLQETLDFYTIVLGFEIKMSFTEWAYLKNGNCEIMFQPSNTLIKEFPELLTTKTGGGLTIFIQLDHVKEYYEQIKDNVNAIRPLGITEYNGANEFVIEDLNGYILHFSDVTL